MPAVVLRPQKQRSPTPCLLRRVWRCSDLESQPEVARAYVNMRLAQKRLDVAQENAKTQQEALDIANWRYLSDLFLRPMSIRRALPSSRLVLRFPCIELRSCSTAI